jgi:tRNA dimethylallyltransferase
VRQTAIDRIFGLKKKLQKLNAKKILTGCVIKSDLPKFKEFFNEILSINQFLGKNYLGLKPKYLFPKSAFVPIMTGCNNFCSYCVVPNTRGREISRSVKEVISEVRSLIKRGYKEITLLGQNVNSYEYNFAKLLEKINDLAGNFQIKFLTSHPKDMSDELIYAIAKSEKVSKEIHLPVQSGDDEILRKMNRGYTAKQYLNLIGKIKRKILEVKITTDVIVGFPGETKKQFENTVKLFKKVGFSLAYVNKYSTRQGTAAAHFKDDVPLEEKKRRWKILNDLVNRSVSQRTKLIVVLGLTASGKSDLAIKIAKQFNGEIVSADSRQIYKGINIGTGKVTKKEMDGIPHYCIDVVSPQKQITVAEYRKKTLEAIDKIYRKGKIPILCGGTGFYIRAVVDNIIIPKVTPDWKLRKELEKKTTEELFKQLKKIDSNRAKNIDAKNSRRLIRAIEIVLKTGRPISKFQVQPQFDVLYLGIKKSPQELKRLINKRVDKMIKIGLEKEVKNLVKKYGWTTVFKNAIGYAEWKDFKNKKIIADAIKNNTYQYAKRQITWFKKYPGDKIHWITNQKQAEKLVKEFLD